jgi:hypothetical protein
LRIDSKTLPTNNYKVLALGKVIVTQNGKSGAVIGNKYVLGTISVAIKTS